MVSRYRPDGEHHVADDSGLEGLVCQGGPHYLGHVMERQHQVHELQPLGQTVHREADRCEHEGNERDDREEYAVGHQVAPPLRGPRQGINRPILGNETTTSPFLTSMFSRPSRLPEGLARGRGECMQLHVVPDG